MRRTNHARLLPVAALTLSTAVPAALGQIGTGDDTPPAEARRGELTGVWRAALMSAGGELPFSLRINAAGAEPPAVAINGRDESPFTAVTIDGNLVVLEVDFYDSRIRAALSPDGSELEGVWMKTTSEGISTMPFSATKGETRRFFYEEPVIDPAVAVKADSIGGTWHMTFVDDDGPEPARGQFVHIGVFVSGTIMTPLGDYRYLGGDVRHGRLRLSCFDGGHAFLLDGVVQPDGTFRGDFWSGDSYHATWTARPPTGGGFLPDPWAIVKATAPDRTLHFALSDLDGNPVSLEDPRFAGKVVLVNIFGSWCPNCHDEAPLLAEWHRRYRDRGLEIVGLAFEHTGDAERDRAQARIFADRHGLEYPVCLAGVSDKTAAAEVLPDLSAIPAYPTTVFIGRDGRIRRIYSGFSGPATGPYHEQLTRNWRVLIERLLNETPGQLDPKLERE